MQLSEPVGMPRVFVISLRTASGRRERAGSQLQAAEVPFSFFDAVTPPDLSAGAEFRCVDAEAFLVNTGREPVPAEIACFASHKCLWRHCAEIGEPIVVLEDDFTLRPNFPDALRAALLLAGESGFLRLQTDLRAGKTPVAEGADFTLARFTYPPHGLMAYCISPSVAGAFVRDSDVLDAPVDVFVKRYWQHHLPLFALLPYSVEPSALSRDTTIPGRCKRRKPLAIAIRRLAMKIRGHGLRLAWNARFRWQARGARPDLRVTDAAASRRRGVSRV